MPTIVRREANHNRVNVEQGFRSTKRPPGNVPYIVDNLWEWARPPEMPSRRHSVYCGPTVESIEWDGGYPFHVKLHRNATVAQIPPNDARHHCDCEALPKCILSMLERGWPDQPLEARADLAPLWMPCLDASDVDSIITHSPKLDKSTILEKLSIWNEATLVDLNGELPYDNGEIFFTAESWWLEDTHP